MVAISPEEVMKLRSVDNGDGLTEFDLDIIGRRPIRLEIPFHDIYKLRRVAEKLRRFADELDARSRDQSKTPRSALVELRHIGTITATQIRELYPETYKKRPPTTLEDEKNEVRLYEYLKKQGRQ